MRHLLLPLTVVATTALAVGQAHAQAGLLTGGAEELEPIKLSSGQPLTEGPYEPVSPENTTRSKSRRTAPRKSRFTGPDFFRNVWIDEIVVNDLEIRPLGVDSLEFDDEGVMEISFVTIRPGSFTLQVPGHDQRQPEGRLQREVTGGVPQVSG